MPLLLDPAVTPAPLFLVDDHDEAYRIWKDHQVRNQILLHFDAHIDFEWISDKDPLKVLSQKSLPEALTEFQNSYGWSLSDAANNFMHLGNYLHRALQEGMIREWYWIVPESIWSNPHSRRRIWRDLLDYYKYRTGPMTPPDEKENAFTASFFGTPFTVTSLSGLPKIEQPVLLNIDVDFLTTEILKSFTADSLRRQPPWIWPDELIKNLRNLNISSLMTTLSNSVQGGFTPIQFKFFGEALRQMMTGQLDSAYFRLKKSYIAYAERNDTEALEILNSFETHGAYEAARQFRKAQIFCEMSLFDTASEAMAAAVNEDAEFASFYNNAAPFFERMGLPEEAYAEYTMIRAMLPKHVDAQLGEADYWLLLGAKEDAKARYHEVIQENPKHAGAAHRLGSFYRNERDWSSAQHFLCLAIDLNPKDISARLELGEVLIAQRMYLAAKKCLREALGLGCHSPLCYFRLAKTYFHLHYFRKSFELMAEGWRLRLKIMFRYLASLFL